MITQAKFRDAVDKYFAKYLRAHYSDKNYSVITYRSLVEELIPYYCRVRNILIPFYIPDRKDCDDFSLLFVMIARLLNSKDSGTAFGILSYEQEQGPHAIVLCLTDKGIITIEPQETGSRCIHSSASHNCITQLTPSEKASAYFLYA